MLLLDGIIIGLVISFATGGRFRCASQNPIRMEYWLVGGLAAQLLWPRVATQLGAGLREFMVVWALAALLVLGVTVANVRVPGMLLVTVGLLLNLVVIVPNGGMPVDVSRAQVAADEAVRSLAASPLHTPQDGGTVLAALGDVIYVPGPSWHRALVSAGDVLMALGAGIVAFWAVRCRSVTASTLEST